MRRIFFKSCRRAATCSLGFLLIAVLFTTAGMAAELASPWVEGFNNKARLISGKANGGPMGNVTLTYAGIEISMAPGFKTYWRNPGEAGGIPPEFDFSGSENLKSANVLYPAPHRTKDRAGENIAYKDHVILPFSVVPEDETRPVMLKLKAVYGVCKDICIPAEAELSVSIPPDADESAALREALAKVPVRTRDPMLQLPGGTVHDPMAAIDPNKDPALQAWRIEGTAEKRKLVLESRDPGGAGGDAFLFSPDGLYMPMTKMRSEEAGRTVFEADLTEGAKPEELKGKMISVTLTGSKGQSETFIQLP